MAAAVGDQRAGHAMWNLALPLGVTVKERVHHDGPSRIREQFTAQTNQAPAGDDKLHAHPAITVVVHLLHLRLARTQLLDYHADERLGHVNGEPFNWLHQLAVHFFGHDFWLAHRQLETFAAHHLNENGKLQLAARSEEHTS